MDFFKKHIHAIIGVIIYLIIVMLILILLGFRTPLPLPEEEGILLDFGGSGSREISKPSPPASRTDESTAKQTTGVVTQDFEETAALPSSTIPTDSETIDKPSETATQTNRLNELLGDAFGGGTSQSQTGTGSGHPGMGDGTSEGRGTGPGGVGGSIDGRRLLNRVEPEGKDNLVGKVELRITVDENGNVTNIRVVRQTCSECVQLAIDAVRKWKYVPMPGTGYQTGNVTIDFERKR